MTHARVLPRRPPALSAGLSPAAEALRALLERPEKLLDLAPLLRPERRGVPDVVQPAVVVVETEEQ